MDRWSISKVHVTKSIHTGCGFMMFITLRVFLSTERKKLVVAPDLIAKEGQKFLTMVLDRGYVGVSIKGRYTIRDQAQVWVMRPKTSKMRVNKQTKHALSARDQSKSMSSTTYKCTKGRTYFSINCMGRITHAVLIRRACGGRRNYM